MNDDLDRMLSGSPDIEPSPAFARSVMAAVEREAAAPPPIAFPWLRVAPMAAAALCIVAIAVYIAVSGQLSAALPSRAPSTNAIVHSAATPAAMWALVGLLLAATSLCAAAVRAER